MIQGTLLDLCPIEGHTTAPIEFVVYGRAQTAGSKRAFPIRRRDGRLGVAVSDDNPNSKSWKHQVASAAREAFSRDKLLAGPLRLALVFVTPRPRGHFGVKGLLRRAPSRPVVRPDLLKLARAVEDALSGVIWFDDSQIVEEVLQKTYGDPASVLVRVWEL